MTVLYKFYSLKNWIYHYLSFIYMSLMLVSKQQNMVSWENIQSINAGLTDTHSCEGVIELL